VTEAIERPVVTALRITNRLPGAVSRRGCGITSDLISKDISKAYPGTTTPRSKFYNFQLSALMQEARARWSDGQRKVPSAEVAVLSPSFGLSRKRSGRQ